MLLLRDLPTTLKGILDKYCLQEMALQHWLHKRPILVGDFQTIERALSRINAHEIRSLPVVNKDKIVVGLIDIMDIANSISESLKSLSELDEESAGKIRNEFMTTTVGNLLTQGKKKVFVASNRLTLMHTVECLVSTNQERVMIVDRDVEGFVAEQSQTEEFLDGMCTQADVVRFLSQNAALLRMDPLFQKSLSELGLGKRDPFVINENQVTAKAFSQMAEEGLESAAVVDDSGKLIASLCVNDLKGLTRRNCDILLDPLSSFLTREWSRGWWSKPISVSLDDPLYFIVLQFVSSNVHRMYVIDDDGRPIGDVDLMDILKVLIKIT